MVQISKKTLIFLLIFALLLGGAGMVVAVRSGVGGSVLVSNSQYENLVSYRDTYWKLNYLKNFIENNYYEEVDGDALLSGAYYGMIDSLGDPYSSYISAEDYESYISSLMGTETYYGVGITFVSTPTELGFYALSVNSKGPAYAAGVRRGDYIISVDGVDALTMDGDTLRDSIRGELDSEVTIGLTRRGEPYTITIRRMEIEAESVSYEMLEGDVAYIMISEFISNTGKDFTKALKKAESEGAKYLIVDLRDNGGGLVSESINVADELMDKGVVISTLDHDGNVSTYKTSDGRTALPYVLLVNGNTASASEILCAGVQDNNEGTVIGTLTYGKGIIQNISMLSDGSAVKYTELQYLSPNGTKIHQVGITPDIEIDLDDSCYNEYGFLENDVQLNRAIEFLTEGK